MNSTSSSATCAPAPAAPAAPLPPCSAKGGTGAARRCEELRQEEAGAAASVRSQASKGAGPRSRRSGAHPTRPPAHAPRRPARAQRRLLPPPLPAAPRGRLLGQAPLHRRMARLRLGTGGSECSVYLGQPGRRTAAGGGGGFRGKVAPGRGTCYIQLRAMQAHSTCPAAAAPGPARQDAQPAPAAHLPPSRPPGTPSAWCAP